MARSTKLPSPRLPEVSADKGISLLRQQIEKGRTLLASRPISSDDYSAWELVTRNYLEKAFGKNSPNVTSVTSAGHYGSSPMNAGEQWWENHRAENLQTKLRRLEALVELLSTEIALDSTGHVNETPVPP